MGFGRDSRRAADEPQPFGGVLPIFLEVLMASIEIRVIERLADNRVILNCALCGGSGQKPGHKSHVACDVCGGKGVALVEGSPPFVACRLCHGTGNKPGYKSWVECDACQGIGAQPLTGALRLLR